MKKYILFLSVFVLGAISIQAQDTDIFINAGSSKNVIYDGNAYLGDYPSTTLYTWQSTHTNSTYNEVQTLFTTEAHSDTLSYRIPVPMGTYTVRTFHNELYFGYEGREDGPGKRVFDIVVEDVLKVDDFDIYVANNNNPVVHPFAGVSVNDGFLNIEIIASVQEASLSGIAVVSDDLGTNPTEIYINTGSDTDMIFEGNTYRSEDNIGFNSNRTFTNTNASSEPLFQTERNALTILDKLTYGIEVPNGTYTVKTHHNELYFGYGSRPEGPGIRVFDIIIEDSLLVDDFDLFVVNNNNPYTHTFTNIEVNDGLLTIDMPENEENPNISGIAIEKTDGTSSFNLYLNAGGADVSYDGHTYKSDADYFPSSNSPLRYMFTPPAEEMFKTGRKGPYGDLSYMIPLPNGIYTVKTHHNEPWFGKNNNAPAAGIGNRVFDISLEGVLLKDDFDIYVESYNYPTTLTFDDIVVLDGELNLDMVSSANLPQVNGISIVLKVPYNVPDLSTDENYVFSRAYQKEMTTYDPLAVSDGDVIEQVSYIDGLGRPKQQIAIEASGFYEHINPVSNVPAWQYDWTPGNNGTPFFNKIGDAVENVREYKEDPYGESSLVWNCVNDSAADADGGWNTDFISIDNTKTYLYTVWVKKVGSVADGNTYHGTHNVNKLDGTKKDNPYFFAGQLPTAGNWYLMVGVVHPYGHTTDMGISGVYDTEGNKVKNGVEYTWLADATKTTRFRNYLFNATAPSTGQYYFAPLLQQVDAANLENSLEFLFGKVTGLKDMVTHVEYDAYGRAQKQWLPHQEAIGNDGSYRNDDMAINTQKYYQARYGEDFTGLSLANVNAYSETEFEASPLNRPLRQAAPGKDWALNAGHEIQLEYQSNAANEVRFYDVSFNNSDPANPQITGNGSTYFAEGELYKSVTKDENWTSGKNHTTEEFTNQQGQVVLKRTYSNTLTSASTEIAHDTYYVYDDFGNLTYVLPPGVDTGSGITTATLNELCYQYKYDYRNRLIEKKIPGKGWEYIVYNNLNQPILTQDPNLQAQGQWLFTKYDAFGRVTYTGMALDARNRAAIQTEVNNLSSDLWVERGPEITLGNGQLSYTNTAYPTSSIAELYTVNYYDDYNFDLDGLVSPTGNLVFNQAVTSNVRGLATGSKVRVLETQDWITTVSWFDSKARPIYVASKNTFLESLDIVESDLDFTGKPEKVKTTHTKGTQAPIVTIDDFEYDHQARLVKQIQTLLNEEEVIAVNTYDGIGQMTQKKVGGILGAPLQTVDYNYNVRGWLKNINDVNNLESDLFAFQIGYNEGNVPLFNGNIANTQWRTANEDDSSLKRYDYTYDPMNRITAATSAESLGAYNLTGVSYDKMGNITYLEREGHTNAAATSFGTMDALSYAYDGGNKLQSVTDGGNATYGFKDGNTAGNDYAYDVNGNMTMDLNKGITSIEYNYMNLPTKVTVNNSEHNGNVQFIYAADRTKLRKIVSTTGAQTDYAGPFVYENGNLVQFAQAEGYVEPDGSGGYDYFYSYLDHLKTVRLTYSDFNGNGSIEPNSEIMMERNTYPFGLEHRGYNGNINGRESNYQTYLGQEINRELGLDWLTFRYRNYMPEIGRFFGIDPVATEYMSISTYQFAHNSPVWKIELEGLEGEGTSKPDNLTKEPVKVLPTDISIDREGSMENLATLSATVALAGGKKPNKISGAAAVGIFATGTALIVLADEGTNIFNMGAAMINSMAAELTGEEATESLEEEGESIEVELELPGLDSTGKVHGDLPTAEELGEFADDELEILAEDLKTSVQSRIRATNEKGPSATKQQNKQHGERQAEEQNLIKSIEKLLKNRNGG